jgi:hypothetical protein
MNLWGIATLQNPHRNSIWFKWIHISKRIRSRYQSFPCRETFFRDPCFPEKRGIFRTINGSLMISALLILDMSASQADVARRPLSLVGLLDLFFPS